MKQLRLIKNNINFAILNCFKIEIINEINLIDGVINYILHMN